MHFFGPVKVAQPFTNSAPAPFKSASTPLFNRSTMASFQPTKAAMSISGSEARDSPIWPPSLACCCSDSNLSAAWIIALLGIQPLIKQVPPALSPSTITVSKPSWALRIAATYPPGPAPTTSTLHLRVSVIFPPHMKISAGCSSIRLSDCTKAAPSAPSTIL